MRGTAPSRRCGRRGCKEDALWRPVLVLAPADGPGRIVLALPIEVCEAHRGDARIEAVLSIAGVELVESILRDVELPDIRWDRSSVTFVSLDDSAAPTRT